MPDSSMPEVGVKFSTVSFAAPLRPTMARRAVSDFAAPPHDLYEVTVSPKTSMDARIPVMALNDSILNRRRSSVMSMAESAHGMDRASIAHKRQVQVHEARRRAAWIYCTLVGAVVPASVIFGMWLSLRFLQPVSQAKTEL